MKDMPKNSTQQRPKRKKPEEIVRILADKHALTTRQIQNIISGDSINEKVFADYMIYTEQHNELLREVKKLVPFG